MLMMSPLQLSHLLSRRMSSANEFGHGKLGLSIESLVEIIANLWCCS